MAQCISCGKHLITIYKPEFSYYDEDNFPVFIDYEEDLPCSCGEETDEKIVDALKTLMASIAD